MKKTGVVFILLILSAPCWGQYFTGDGGRGKSIAILSPRASGLTAEQQYIPDLVQGEFVSNFNTYSAIRVLDRVTLERQYAELLSGYYNDNAGSDLGHLIPTDYLMVGNITRTATSFALQMQITRDADKTTAASYSQTVTFDDLDNLTGIRRASLDLLQKLGVTPTQQTRTELTRAAEASQVNAQTALARGINAQRQGTEVAALSYYFQAAAFDPALAEAVNRSSILAANISSGNIGEDARNDIQWRNAWVARLRETEQYFNSYFDNFFRTLPPMPYTLYYTNEIRQIGEINYQNETVTLGGMVTILLFSQVWVQSVEPVLQSMQASVQAVLDGLNATGRKTVWGLNWPQQSSFNVQSFGRQSRNFTIAVELVNSQNQVIGRQTFQTGGTYEFSVPLPGRGAQRVQVSADDRKTVSFPNVKVDDITDSLTVRIASVNGTSAETAARNGVLQIQTISEEYRRQAAAKMNEQMIRINGGTFMMGSPANEPQRDSGETQHQVTVSSFYMGKYLVTQREYWDVMGSNPSNFDGDNLPVERVSWYDALVFCNKLSMLGGLSPAYRINGSTDPAAWGRVPTSRDRTWDVVTIVAGSNGYRLPTEAQWEYACRAGTTTAYNTGSSINNNTGWYSSNSGSRTREVGLKPPNAWGLYDMHGNVWEWCWDWLGNYASGAQTDPTGAVSGIGRVGRGGSWDGGGLGLRSAFRGAYGPSGRGKDYGFRLVRP